MWDDPTHQKGEETEKWSYNQFKRGGIPVHPTQPDTLFTPCYIVGGIKGWLKTEEGNHLKMQPHGSTKHNPRCPRRAYVHVKKGKLYDNEEEFGLHRLLCYIYHGPPPPELGENAQVSHKCHHKLCICPWHMEWATQADNVLASWKHKKQKDYAKPT